MSSTLASSPAAPCDPGRTRKGPVLVAVGADGSNVLQAAAALGPVIGERLHVFSVVEPLSAEIIGSEPVMLPPSFEEERRTERIEQVGARIATAAGPGHCWQIEVEHGQPASAIARRARELDASLVVMGIGRHTPIDRLLAGETTLRVIRHAGCPVLAVAGTLDHPPREVIVAIDFSPESAVAAECAAALLAPGATLRLVHVWEPSGSADAELQSMERQYAADLPKRFERLRAALPVPPGVGVTFEAREGKTVPQLLEVAEAHHADMIVAGRHGLGRVARFFVGSVTTALVRGASCAVLVTPEPGFAQLERWQRLLTGTSMSVSPSEWPRQLADFTVRNRGRRTSLEVDDPSIGAQTQEVGYALLGATYDPRDERVELMFGLPHATSPHLTRSIGEVESIAVLSAPSGEDLGLRIAHGAGQTLVTFSRAP